ncbi:MAG: response regulator transcription factor [Flavobacteriales bacterium]|nr:response regulator transcription factor [Flavobacteriales bacterium]
MKILIIEDENRSANRLEKLLLELDPSFEIVEKIESVRKALSFFQQGHKVNLIFADIQLSDGLSFEIFEQAKIDVPIVFTTAYDQYAIRAFKVNGIDYLLKPIDPKELEKSIDKFKSFTKNNQTADLSKLLGLIKEKESDYKTRFLIKVGDRIKSVFVSDIAAMLSEDKGTYLIDKNGGRHLIDSSLDKIYLMIDPRQFFRINRKYIVNIDSISEIYSWRNSRLKILIKNHNDKMIIVAREKAAEFKLWLDR